MGFPLSISAKTQPTLHMSIARVYSLNVSMTSGARYHLDGASDINVGWAEAKLYVPCSDILGHERAAVICHVGWWSCGSREAKVT